MLETQALVKLTRVYWRDGLHLKKKGCNMLANIYADNIGNALNKTTSHHHLHQPLKETSTPPRLSSSSCSYVHVSPQPTTSPPHFAIYHRCHHHPQFEHGRQKVSKPANMENKRDCSESDDVSDDSNFNVDGVENSSVSCHGCVIPWMCHTMDVSYHGCVIPWMCDTMDV